MNQIHNFQIECLKFLNTSYIDSLGLLKRLISFNTASNANLLRLTSQLNHWNLERITKKTIGQTLELTLDDVNVIKALTKTAISKASIKHSETIYDQLVFLTIGAIQVQSQTGSDKAWALVNQTIKNHLNAQKSKRILLLGPIVATILTCLSVMTLPKPKVNHLDDILQISPSETVASGTDPVSMSMLLLAYNKMKSGTCQLPQAAMLPPEQRQVFLRFINHGFVEVNHVENLRLALGYVNCLYPQELMHPTASTGNRL